MHTIHIFITTQRKHTQQHQQKKHMTLGEVQRDGVMKLKGFKSNELIMLKPHSEREGGMVFLCSHMLKEKNFFYKNLA